MSSIEAGDDELFTQVCERRPNDLCEEPRRKKRVILPCLVVELFGFLF
jgi:hypothetical protein